MWAAGNVTSGMEGQLLLMIELQGRRCRGSGLQSSHYDDDYLAYHLTYRRSPSLFDERLQFGTLLKIYWLKRQEWKSVILQTIYKLTHIKRLEAA